MNKRLVIGNAEKFVKERLSGEGTGHDWWHIERVRNNARLICKSEKADRFIVDISLLLHDVGDRKVIDRKEDDYSIAENFLRKQKVPQVILEEVMYIIKNMSFSKSLNRKKKKASREFYIVQDADRLDAVGAIGIARAFAYGGSKSRPLYDPNKKAQKITSTWNYTKNKSSSFHHLEEKVLLLKDLMNTKAAKRIAKARHEHVKEYMRQFLAEWQGKQ